MFNPIICHNCRTSGGYGIFFFSFVNMKRLFCLIPACLFLLTGCIAQSGNDGFSAEVINDSVWQFMQGKTYHENPHIQRDDLRYLRLLHWDYDGQTHTGEMVCNKVIADDLLDIFRELYKAHYPIERMVLPDNYDADDERSMADDNTSGFCFRKVDGSKKMSKHALGMAVDINPLYNPCVRTRKDGTVTVQPQKGLPYADRKKKSPYSIVKGDLCHRLFTQYGFTWGGAWDSVKDYQHFER